MLLRTLSLQNFRNIAAAKLGFEGRRQFLVGANGQGKTNVLEAAGCLTALRSFRTADSGAMIRQGFPEAGIAAEVDHEHRGATRLRLLFRPDGKEIWSDQERVKRLADHLGQFPVVAFSSQDIQLVRGSPAGRRRWMDLTLSAMDAGYLRALQTYTRAMAGRNKLLKQGNPALAELTAFEQVLAPAAAELVRQRMAGMAELSAAVAAAYTKLSGADEGAALSYDGPAPGADTAAGPSLPAYWKDRWERDRAVDLRLRGTLHGPHRDDLALSVKGASARECASEGQQRSLVLALRLAQAAWFHGRSRTRPVILADDVLGELDPARRRAFWAALDPAAQVLASGTTLPDPELGPWQIFRVDQGVIGA
jgi:DNA replication and repair protein RecF